MFAAGPPPTVPTLFFESLSSLLPLGFLTTRVWCWEFFIFSQRAPQAATLTGADGAPEPSSFGRSALLEISERKKEVFLPKS